MRAGVAVPVSMSGGIQPGASTSLPNGSFNSGTCSSTLGASSDPRS